ncbi:MAG: formyltransferase [Burkholderiaceae bacterium]|nr:formyltransferase [Burkholderiaceae bacterium]
MSSAIVFAYHNVGVRCLKVLLAHGVEVKLVLTHPDNPQENIWFESVQAVCDDYGIPCISPADPNVPEIEQQLAALAPDFVFSFYYRHMLQAPLLAIAQRGAFNMHGSLLPKYRGRAPVNWAVLHGERETGASLHAMNLKPDNGALVDQVAVPILPNDTSHDVFAKVTVAAEVCLDRALPALLDGTAKMLPQDLKQGAYFGGRGAADGRIVLAQNARQIHNLVRAVSRPYPGAFLETAAGKLLIWRSRVLAPDTVAPATSRIESDHGRLLLHPAGGGILHILDAELNGQPLTAASPIFPLNLN